MWSLVTSGKFGRAMLVTGTAWDKEHLEKFTRQSCDNWAGLETKLLQLRDLKVNQSSLSKMTNVKTVYLHFQIKVEPIVYQSLKNVN